MNCSTCWHLLLAHCSLATCCQCSFISFVGFAANRREQQRQQQQQHVGPMKQRVTGTLAHCPGLENQHGLSRQQSQIVEIRLPVEVSYTGSEAGNDTGGDTGSEASCCCYCCCQDLLHMLASRLPFCLMSSLLGPLMLTSTPYNQPIFPQGISLRLVVCSDSVNIQLQTGKGCKRLSSNRT